MSERPDPAPGPGPVDGGASGPASGAGAAWSTGATAAGAAFLFILLRLMAVAHYDWDTASGLADVVDFSDAVTIAVGTFLGAGRVAAWLMAAIVPLTAAGHLRHLREGRPSPASLLVVLALVAVFAAAVVSFSAWGALASGLVWFAVLAAVDLRPGPVRDLLRRLVARVGLLTLAAVLTASAISDEVWVSRERIALGDRVVEGYVIKNGGQFLTVLTAEEREKRILLSREVTSRTGVG
ncbi:hypothetical protein [Nocardiopsis chromatogenes]|uniref:hypothetical protein n=1 Tax=Nocardiopsis chromatogenes TaxID=280239 RepID=UPI000374AECC|nr:hypothetical protein [Nocardiopsis chromatogenes]